MDSCILFATECIWCIWKILIFSLKNFVPCFMGFLILRVVKFCFVRDESIISIIFQVYNMWDFLILSSTIVVTFLPRYNKFHRISLRSLGTRSCFTRENTLTRQMINYTSLWTSHTNHRLPRLVPWGLSFVAPRHLYGDLPSILIRLNLQALFSYVVSYKWELQNSTLASIYKSWAGSALPDYWNLKNLFRPIF